MKLKKFWSVGGGARAPPKSATNIGVNFDAEKQRQWWIQGFSREAISTYYLTNFSQKMQAWGHLLRPLDPPMKYTLQLMPRK